MKTGVSSAGKALKKGSKPHIAHAGLSKIKKAHEKRYAAKRRTAPAALRIDSPLKDDDPHDGLC